MCVTVTLEVIDLRWHLMLTFDPDSNVRIFWIKLLVTWKLLVTFWRNFTRSNGILVGSVTVHIHCRQGVTQYNECVDQWLAGRMSDCPAYLGLKVTERSLRTTTELIHYDLLILCPLYFNLSIVIPYNQHHQQQQSVTSSVTSYDVTLTDSQQKSFRSFHTHVCAACIRISLMSMP